MKREIKNFDGKRKYLIEYNTYHSIGELYLINYFTENKNHIFFIEYKIFDEFKCLRNKKIVSKELPKYLKWCKKYDITRILATVREKNIASIKLLEKNHFFEIKWHEGEKLFLRDLAIDPIIQNKKISDYLKITHDV
jgi:RimJ/RimL family protein N-acetyltransferase